jgi:hypothetical protein
MKATFSTENFTDLLQSLLKRITNDSNLKADFEEAKNEFCRGKELDNNSVNRVIEWYFLERVSPRLGTTPIVAWSPNDLSEDDIWYRLLDSFFALFHIIDVEDDGVVILEDLWSAKQVRVENLPKGLEIGTLVPARAVQNSAETHALLPGAHFIVSPDLVNSLAQDLREIRTQQSRAHLSQLEWEHLFQVQQVEETSSSVESSEAELRLLLERSKSGLSYESLLDMVNEKGLAESLNELAFETDLDLEILRTHLGTAMSARPKEEYESKTSDSLSSSDKEIADRLAKTGSEEDLLELESKLGISDAAEQILNEKTESTGVDIVPGVEMWLRTYLFEREANEDPVIEEEGKEIEKFLNHCVNHVGANNLDPHELLSSTILAYLMNIDGVEELKHSLRNLDEFCDWLCHEQDAPIQDILPLVGGDTESWMEDLIKLNRELMQNGFTASQVETIVKVDPLSIRDENEQLVEIVGVGNIDNIGLLQEGDKIMGQWQEGKFGIAAWIPKKILGEQGKL